MKTSNTYLKIRSEKGSLALEQILFIGAVVLISGGLVAFYTDISNWLGGAGEQVTRLPGVTDGVEGSD